MKGIVSQSGEVDEMAFEASSNVVSPSYLVVSVFWNRQSDDLPWAAHCSHKCHLERKKVRHSYFSDRWESIELLACGLPPQSMDMLNWWRTSAPRIQKITSVAIFDA